MNTNQIHLEGNTGTGWQFAGTCQDLTEANLALELRQRDYAETDWRIVIGNDENTRKRALLYANAPALLAALEGLEIVYAEYMALRPDPNSDACTLVMKLVQNARTVIAQAVGRGGELGETR